MGHVALIVTAVILCASVSFGCADHPAGPGELPLGESFELRPGRSATLRDGLKVTFDSVRSDSRCPMDALCVWAGDATISVRLSTMAGAQAAQRELHTYTRQSEAQFLGYVIKLVALAPYPRSDRQIHADDYVATLTVEAR